jgi:hypothetical protein
MQNNSRSLNHSLDEGATDGKYRKVRRNVEVDGFDATAQARKHLHPWYGYPTTPEATGKVRGDGLPSSA